MDKYILKEDCFCEGYLHEALKYPRKDLVEKKLYKNDIVNFKREWFNFYGYYFTVVKDGVEYDIPPSKLKKLHE